MDLRKDYITAIADNEEVEPSQLSLLKDELSKNKSLHFDLDCQLMMKKIVAEKCEWKKAPSSLRSKIELQIKPKEKKRFRFFSLTPRLGIGFAAALLIAVILIIFNLNSPVTEEQIAEQKVETKDLLQTAYGNFNAITEGKLNVQIASDNPEEIKNFFAEKGVDYSVEVPEIKDYKILGAVVSVENGEELAHHVYRSSSGSLIYLFQLNEEHLNNNLYNCSKEVEEKIKKGECFVSQQNDAAAIILKKDQSFFAAVSNSSSDLKNIFCN